MRLSPRPCLTCGYVYCDMHRPLRGKQRAAYSDPLYRSLPISSRCAICGATSDLTRDHIVPLARGGTNAASNIRTLCRSCNSRKGAS